MINPLIETNVNGDCFRDADVHWRFIKPCTVVGDNNINEHVSYLLLPKQTGCLLRRHGISHNCHVFAYAWHVKNCATQIALFLFFITTLPTQQYDHDCPHFLILISVTKIDDPCGFLGRPSCSGVGLVGGTV